MSFRFLRTLFFDGRSGESWMQRFSGESSTNLFRSACRTNEKKKRGEEDEELHCLIESQWNSLWFIAISVGKKRQNLIKSSAAPAAKKIVFAKNFIFCTNFNRNRMEIAEKMNIYRLIIEQKFKDKPLQVIVSFLISINRIFWKFLTFFFDRWAFGPRSLSFSLYRL